MLNQILNVEWEEFDFSAIEPSDLERSRRRFRAHLPDLIWNTAALEGNTFTLPEVRTLLDNVTVGGHRTEEAAQILALSAAYNRLDELVGSGRFSLSKNISDELHGLVAVYEALESGHFRDEGSATGGGNVRLSNGGVVTGVDHGVGGCNLRDRCDELIAFLEEFNDGRFRALVYFAVAVRQQFYFDGNKRTARLMMVGELMTSGWDFISVPFARKLEFNKALDRLFSDDDASSLLKFLGTCSPH